MRRSDLGWILLLAAAARAVLYLVWSPELAGDAATYHQLAARVAGGEGFVTAAGEPTSWRPPVYPLFVAAVYLVTGVVPEAVRWFQLPVDLATVGLTWWLAGRLFGRGAGIVAGVLVAVNLGTASASGRVLSETLFTFFLVASAAALLEAARAEGDRRLRIWAVVAGLLLGGAVLTKGIVVFYPALAAGALWLWLRRRGRSGGRALAAPGLLLAAFLVTLVPWTVRNWRAQGAFVPVASQGGYTLYSSYHPPDGWRFGMRARDEVSRRAAGMPEPEASGYFVRETLRTVAEHPERLPRLELLKVLFHWVALDWEILPWYGAFNPTYAFILIFAGLFVLRQARGRDPPRPSSWPCWLPVAYVFLMALVFYGSPRFRLPVEPFLAVFAGAGLAGRADREGAGRALAEAGVLAALLVAFGLAVEPLKDVLRGWVVGGPG